MQRRINLECYLHHCKISVVPDSQALFPSSPSKVSLLLSEACHFLDSENMYVLAYPFN